jgi:MFS family permease
MLSDKYGRKSFFQVGVATNFIAFTFVMINTSFWVQVVLLFLMGLNSPTTYIIGFGYLQELVDNKHKSIYATFFNLSEGLIYVITTIYYWKISSHWVYILSFGYFLCALSLMGSFFLPESPVFLVNEGRLGEARKSFDYIARFNNR